jgi:hypothetical protein
VTRHSDFPMPIETLRGSHHEMGLQHGRALRHTIVGAAHTWVLRHDFQWTDEEADAVLAPARLGDETFALWVLDELRGIADGSGVPLPLIQRMHWRVWNWMTPKPLPPHAGGCTGIGLIADDDGPIVAGTCDDPRQCYTLIRRVPKEGIPHVMINWVGVGWGHNGVNAAGLAVAQCSLGGCTPTPTLPQTGARLRSSMGTRILLETCSDVPEALQTIGRLQSRESLVLGDAKGNLVACQSFGGLHVALQKPEDCQGLVFNTNHIHMPDLVEKVRALGCVPELTEYSVTRFAALEHARAALPRTRETVERLLRSHEGHPHSICNHRTLTATFARPQSEPAVLYVADSPPCRNDFHAYPVVEEK